MNKNSTEWFDSIKWDKVCLECQSENGGKCERRGCAELHYDEWGDYIPDWLYYHDGNKVQEYLAEKRRTKGE